MSSQNLEIYQIDNKWLNFREDTNDKIKIGKINRDTIIYTNSINSFNYYKLLLKYFENLNNDCEIIRLINSQAFQVLDKNFHNFNDIYKPQSYFIYRKIGDVNIHIVYINKSCLLIDTILKPKFNFDFLILKNNFLNFGYKFKKPQSYIGPYEGKAISLSIATKNDIFSVYAYDYWQYGDGKIKEFSVISGDKKTIKEVRKLVKQLYEMGVIKDAVFETECK
jgi:hypothetical protein